MTYSSPEDALMGTTISPHLFFFFNTKQIWVQSKPPSFFFFFLFDIVQKHLYNLCVLY